MVNDGTQSARLSAAAPAVLGLHLDLVSDSICPWCYVGKRRLGAAIDVLASEGVVFEVSWRPFQLNPDMPREGLDRRQYRAAKFGSWEKSQALDAQVAEAGRTVGLTFRHDIMTKTPNTLASHRLIRLAREAGGSALEERTVEAVLAAYFTLGRDIGDPEVLANLGEEAGLERASVVQTLADPVSAAAVAEDENFARRLGLTGVPSVVFNGGLLVCGAEPVFEIARKLRAAALSLVARPGATLPKEPLRVDR